MSRRLPTQKEREEKKEREERCTHCPFISEINNSLYCTKVSNYCALISVCPKKSNTANTDVTSTATTSTDTTSTATTSTEEIKLTKEQATHLYNLLTVEGYMEVEDLYHNLNEKDLRDYFDEMQYVKVLLLEHSILKEYISNVAKRIKRLEELNAPEIILVNERRRLLENIFKELEHTENIEKMSRKQMTDNFKERSGEDESK